MPFVESTNAIQSAQVALSGTASQLVPARPHRWRITVYNLEDTAGVIVYLGQTAAVTANNGFPLAGQESISLYTSAPVFAIAASATPVVAVIEEFQS